MRGLPLLPFHPSSFLLHRSSFPPRQTNPAMENLEHPTADEERPGRGWHGPFTWTGLLAVGWVLYELTAQPAVGAVAVCLKFGWEDFRTALWLRRRDPDRRRGRACFWLYAGNGL